MAVRLREGFVVTKSKHGSGEFIHRAELNYLDARAEVYRDGTGVLYPNEFTSSGGIEFDSIEDGHAKALANNIESPWETVGG